MSARKPEKKTIKSSQMTFLRSKIGVSLTDRMRKEIYEIFGSRK
jgi:hypothetical protein